MPKPLPPLEPMDFGLAVDAMCRPRSRQAARIVGADLNSASRKRSGPVAMLMRERDNLLAEGLCLRKPFCTKSPNFAQKGR